MTALFSALLAVRGRRSGAMIVALVGCLVKFSSLQAQMTPFESTMRGRVGTGFGQVPMERGGEFKPRVETAVQYFDNINLASGDMEQEINTGGIELAPGFYASYSSDSITAAIDYSVAARAWDESDYNDVTQIGSANGRWLTVPEYFYIDAQSSITEAVIDPAVSLNYGGLGIFGQDNLNQVATAGVMPTFDRQFGDFNALARYSYGRVWYFDEGSVPAQPGFLGEDDSRDQSAYVSFGNRRSGRKLTGDVNYTWQKTDYDNALPYNYEKLAADFGWQVTQSTSLVAGFGVESDLDESTTSGGLGSNFWDIGFRWEPDDRSYFEARYGDRFFGRSYYVSARRTARMVEVTASYSEVPAVETQILSLGDFNPGELPPGTNPDFNFGRLNSDPYVGKDANVGITAIGSRTRVGVTGYLSEQDYIRATEGDFRYAGGSFWINRRFASNLSGDFSANYSDYEQTRSDGTPSGFASGSYNDTTLIGRLNRTASGGKLTTSLESGFVNRSGSEDYTAWWVGLRLRWQP
jgi:hypothetical protein